MSIRMRVCLQLEECNRWCAETSVQNQMEGRCLGAAGGGVGARTLGPDVDVPAGVSRDGVSVLSERHAEDVLGLLVFLPDTRRTHVRIYTLT